ncbi:MAG: phytoene/squalene synthase family protein [Candidatus Thermoplasmatota archaeon]|nr:phytoene/squalene synthase family protein [Candidatus Thermoplasmatota archaeon]MBS3790844.1 phytoene/squalene synthase family protein [Candidatus Thermoplasmatota archaeon]
MINKIFKKGGKTYYYSSKFFPKDIRRDVSILYSFVRKADDFVDAIPQREEQFYDFKEKYEQALSSGKKSENQVIDAFIDLMDRQGFEEEWIDAFLHSMELDIIKNEYETLDGLKEYLYGSAEVIGLMMAKILDLPEESFRAARHLGRAMQYANFIRDIEEDISLNRQYFPTEDLKKFDLNSLKLSETREKKENFSNFIDHQVNRFEDWQDIAEEGFRFIPKRYLIPIKTASDMYKWTAKGVRRNPYIVYNKKLKPSKTRIVMKGLFNIFYPKDMAGNL